MEGTTERKEGKLLGNQGSNEESIVAIIFADCEASVKVGTVLRIAGSASPASTKQRR